MHASIQSARAACTQAWLGRHVVDAMHNVEIAHLRRPISRLYNYNVQSRANAGASKIVGPWR